MTRFLVALLSFVAISEAFVALRYGAGAALRLKQQPLFSVSKHIVVRNDPEPVSSSCIAVHCIEMANALLYCFGFVCAVASRQVPLYEDRAMAVVYKPAGVLDAPLAPAHGHGRERSLAHM